MSEPPTIPDPEPVTGAECWHPQEAGRRVEFGTDRATLRCGRCGAPLAQRLVAPEVIRKLTGGRDA